MLNFDVQSTQWFNLPEMKPAQGVIPGGLSRQRCENEAGSAGRAEEHARKRHLSKLV
jgi:hypothetical protein